MKKEKMTQKQKPTKELSDILKGVASGSLSIHEACDLIEQKYQKGFLKKLYRLKEKMNLEELLRMSGKIPESLLQNLQLIGFVPGVPGLEARLSVFRALDVSADTELSGNQATGSQWFDVSLSAVTRVRDNTFTGVQLSGMSSLGSDLFSTEFFLTRLVNLTLQESRLEKNKIYRSLFSDLSITESDFTNNQVLRSELSETVINSSRFDSLVFRNSLFKGCEFDACDLGGIVFEDCHFEECIFSHVSLVVSDTPLRIVGRRIMGKHISVVADAAEFMSQIEDS